MTLAFLRTWWSRLTEPPQYIQDAAERRRAQLLSSLYLVMIPMGSVGVLFQYLLSEPSQRASLVSVIVLMIIITAVVAVAYILARTKYYRQIVSLTLLFATLAVSAAVYLHPAPIKRDALLFFIVPSILAGTFLRLQRAIAYIAINLLVLLVVAVTGTALGVGQALIGPFSVVGLSSAILLLAYEYRNRLEQDRQQELSQREARYRGLFETAFEALAIHDGTTILDHNLGFGQMFGDGKQNLTGMPLLTFIEPASHDLVASVLVAGAPKPFEALGLKRDGTSFHIEIIAKVTIYDNQRINIVAMRDISRRKKVEEELRVSLVEKEILLKEIHHRVKNNLQVISSLLNLQATKVHDPELLAQFQDSQGRIRTMSLIHEQLYRSDNFTNIEFGEYVRELTTSLTQSYQRHNSGVVITVDAETMSLDLDTAIPCGLLVNELISNALKHAFPNGQGGKVSVTINRTESSYIRLTVSDNGIGLPLELDYRQTTTLGLRLITSLSRQLNASIIINTNPGTRFEITFLPNGQREN